MTTEPRRPTRVTAILAITLAAAVGSSCTRDPSVRCGPTVVEQLDPANLHLLPNAPPPSYLTDPPTSGPHVAGLRVSGLQSEPIDPVAQVSSLEVGVVIIQHRGLDAESTARLGELASDTVAVAPADSLPAAVVATGWGRKLQCDGVDPERLGAFVATATPLAPGGHGPP